MVLLTLILLRVYSQTKWGSILILIHANKLCVSAPTVYCTLCLLTAYFHLLWKHLFIEKGIKIWGEQRRNWHIGCECEYSSQHSNDSNWIQGENKITRIIIVFITLCKHFTRTKNDYDEKFARARFGWNTCLCNFYKSVLFKTINSILIPIKNVTYLRFYVIRRCPIILFNTHIIDNRKLFCHWLWKLNGQVTRLHC